MNYLKCVLNELRTISWLGFKDTMIQYALTVGIIAAACYGYWVIDLVMTKFIIN